MGNKKKLAPFFLAILLITTLLLEKVPDQVAGDDLVCNIRWQPCTGVCYKSGKCMRCCKQYGFYHGRCILIKGDGCYCCHDPNHSGDGGDDGQQQRRH